MNGFRLSDIDLNLSAEELEWRTFLRMISSGPVASPTLRAVQALRAALGQMPPASCCDHYISAGEPRRSPEQFWL